MQFEDLHDYIQHLAKLNYLRVISDEVDPDLELTQILSEEQRAGGSKTLVFEKVKGSSVPAVGNIFSTMDKMKLILGDDPQAIGERLRNLTRMPEQSESMISRGFEMWRELGGVRPKISSGLPGNYQEMEKVDLARYPICRTWPKDAGKFITLPLVITKNPVTGERNAGMYRMQVYDSETTGMHWHIHKGGSQHFLLQGKKEMDVAVVIGSDPLTMFSAVAPLPEYLDEFSFVGLVSKKRMELAKGKTVDLEYPRNAEIVLEGYIDPDETRMEGPFGDHTGYYSLEDVFPVFHIRKIIERKDRIYPTTIVGKLWHEDVVIGKAIERMFLPLIQMQFPEIVDLNTMEEAVFHDMVVVSIKKKYPGHAKKVMFAMWSFGQLMFSKIVLVVDDDINVHDRKQVIWAMGTRVDPERDVLIVPGTLTDSLDHASPIMNYGSKMGIDATRKTKAEGYNRTWPDVLEMTAEIEKKVKDRWVKLGL
ncbi:MAG: menaquinone biosynthesis decarboxylase [Thermoplasmataceae archaeon]